MALRGGFRVSEYIIDAHGEFEFEGERFHIDLTPGRHRRPSDGHAFTIVKTRAFLEIYTNLAKSRPRPKSMLELGIFQGGSFVFLDKLFKPDKLAAVDLSAEPVEPLVRYASKHAHRYLHFNTSQDDATALDRIVDTELDGEIDVIVDDASHNYEQTKRSFEILFPKLAPSGIYMIEDWAWSHTPAHQEPSAAWRNRPALTNLIFELVCLLGSSDKIAAINIYRPLLVITKSRSDAKISRTESTEAEIENVWSKMALRGKSIRHI
jgi:predicted O-methyltransferase YrrM